MDNIPIDVVRLADSSDEPYNKYKKTNEDRLNANFRRLKEVSEQLGESTEQLEDDTSKLLTPQTLTVTNSYVATVWFAKIGGVKTVCIYDLFALPQNQATTIIEASDMADYLPTIPVFHDVTGLAGGERVRIYIDINGIHAYNFSANNTQIYVGVNIAYI